MDTDKTPTSIEVWACPRCGYWRREQSSGVHQSFEDNGPGRRHDLVRATYNLATTES